MKDREILRALAGEIAEIAHLDVQKQNAQLYRALNRLEPIRPVVLLDELPWNQLNGDGELTLRCENPSLRSVEQTFRRTLYKWRHCRADMIVEPFFRLPRNIDIGDMGVTVSEDTLSTDEGNNVISHRFNDQLPDVSAIERLHVPEIALNEALDQAQYAALDAVFGDLLPIRHMGLEYAGFFQPIDYLAMWHGIEPFLRDLIDDPDYIHAFMSRYLDIQLALLKKEEDLGLLEADLPLLHCTAGLCDELPRAENGKVSRANLWGRGAAQIFSEVSPRMHDEYDIAYQKKFFKGFGLVYYGCCEPLDRKIEIIRKLPNLRKISITPWADVRRAAEQMGGDYVLSRKPNPAFVALPVLDEDAIRADIAETLQITKETGTPCEFVLKDISTVAYNPENLSRWADIAMEMVRNF